MKKKLLLILPALLAFGSLAGCSTNNPIDNEQGGDSEGQNPGGDSQGGQTNNKISLRMFGDVHKGGIRTIYATKEASFSDELEWESSNEDVVKVSPRENLDTECNLIGMDYGSAVITCKSKTNPLISKTMTVEIKQGTPMPVDLYKTITKGVKFTSNIQYLSYDKDYDPTVDSSEIITTIYEEYDPESTVNPNYNDAYSIEVKDSNTGVVAYSKKYVRGTGGYVSDEVHNYKNEVITKNIYTTDYPDGIKFNNSLYVNNFARESELTNRSFETFDNGNTYHYVGDLQTSFYMAATLFAEPNLAFDQFYFKVENNEITKFYMDVDPANQDVTSSTKYGLHCESIISDKGTAKIDHLKPLEHKDIHNDLDTAKAVFKTEHNYKVTYTVNYSDGEKQTNIYTFNDDCIDVISKKNNSITSHTGAKATENGYFEYSYDDETEAIAITSEHTNGFHDVNRYPTFDFATELFEKNSNGEYVIPSGRTNEFIKTCFYFGSLLSSCSFSNSVIALGNGKVSTIKANFTSQYELNGTFTATFEDYGTASIGIDFSKLEEDDGTPKSWKEANSDLYKNMSYWGVQDIVPYLYASAGWDKTPGRYKNITTGVTEYIFFTSNAFDSVDSAATYIEAYKALLVKLGYVEDSNKIDDQYDTYTKDGYSFAIDHNRNYNGTPNKKARIFIRNSSFTEEMYQNWYNS